MFPKVAGRGRLCLGAGMVWGLHFPLGMKRRGFTLVELLVVVLVISILASLVLAGILAALNAAKETRAQNSIRNIETASVVFSRDHGYYPATQIGAPFDSGPAANALSKLGPKKQPYMYFDEAGVMAWPMSDSSHIRNPANLQTCIHIRDNTRGSGGGHNPFGLDIWAEDCDGNPMGIRNWK